MVSLFEKVYMYVLFSPVFIAASATEYSARITGEETEYDAIKTGENKTYMYTFSNSDTITVEGMVRWLLFLLEIGMVFF